MAREKPFGADHSFPCWGARRKLGDWEFKNLHRINELPQGSRDWYATLQKDVDDARVGCPTCQAKVKKDGK